MALGKRLINTGAAAAVCNTESVQAFGADSAFSSNIALYQLDGNANDTTGDYNGTASNITYATGQFGNAAVFNSSGSKIALNSSIASVFTDSFTFSAWVYPTDNSNYICLFSAEFGMELYFYQGSFQLYSNDINSDTGRNIQGFSTTTTNYAINQWHHVALTFTKTSQTWYINGQQDGTNTTPSYTPYQASLISIGYFERQDGGANNYEFNGSIDQVRIFNRQITAEEVSTLYNETTSTASNTNPLSDGSGVALYSLDYDASDAGGLFDGTPTNVDFGVGGQINYGARFNGSSSKIDTGYSASGDSTFTFSWWMFLTNTGNRNTIISDHRNTAADDFTLFVEKEADNDLNVAIGNNNNSFSQSQVSITSYLDKWSHFVITISGTSVVIYADGSQIHSFTSTIAYGSANSQNYYLGTLGARSILWFDGSIDQVRIFSKALSSSEVSTLYAETACVHTSTTDIVNYPTGTTPIAYYKLDNSSEDYSTGGNDGTDTNIEYRFGRFGQAAVFNGSSSNIAISGSIINSLTSITYSVWVYYKGDVASQSYGHIIGGGGTSLGTGNAIALAVQTSNDYLYAYSPSETSFTTTALPRNTWTHLALTNNGSTTTIYMNGNSVHTASQSLSTNSSGNAFRIGEYFYNGNYHFYGSIDQVRIYDAALTSSQVTELYNEKPEVDTSNFKTVLWEGNGNDNRYISNLGIDLETDGGLVWTKARTAAYYHQFQDTVRGAGANAIYSNSTDAENGGGSTYNTDFGYINSFEANGWFTKNGSDGLGTWVNRSGENYVAWVWKGGGDSVNIGVNSITASTPSIASDVSANTDAGFSIVKYSGNSTTGATIGHGLSAPIDLLIVKNLDTSQNWRVQASPLGGTKGASLNTTDDFANAGYWNNTAATDTVFTVDNSLKVNESGNDYIAYCFHSVSGYSKIGSYSGSSSSQRIYVTDDGTSSGSGGFEPSWVMIKRTDTTGNWIIYDKPRGNGDIELYPDSSSNESNASSARGITFQSDGFTLDNSHSAYNASGGDFIYMAFK